MYLKELQRHLNLYQKDIILMKFLPIHYILMTIVHIWVGLLTLISHYEIEKVNYPKEDQPFIKWYYPQFAIGLGEVPEKIDSIFNNEIQNILNDANTLISEDNFEQYQAEVYDSIIEGFKKSDRKYR